jgi:hypothetical protein
LTGAAANIGHLELGGLDEIVLDFEHLYGKLAYPTSQKEAVLQASVEIVLDTNKTIPIFIVISEVHGRQQVGCAGVPCLASRAAPDVRVRAHVEQTMRAPSVQR